MNARLVGRLVKQTWSEFNDDHAPRIGAALAYYTTFSLAPLLVIAMAVAGWVFGDDAAQDQVSEEAQRLLGPTGAEALESMLENAHRAGGGLLATIVGTVTLLLGASTVFVELQGALDAIWDAPPPEKQGILQTLRARFLSFAMVLVIGFLLLVSLLLSAGISGIGAHLGGLLDSPFLAQVLNFVLSLTVITGLFALLYKVLPRVKIAWGDVLVGAFVTALLFSVGKQLIGLYLGSSSIASSYGAAGSFAIMLVWIYYSAQLVLFGAEFTQVYARREGSKAGKKRLRLRRRSPYSDVAAPALPGGTALVPRPHGESIVH